jgi:hypothetical protein
VRRPQRDAAALARRLDDPDHPQAIQRALRHQRAAAEQGCELAGAERLERQRRQRREDVLRSPQRDPVEDLDQPHSPLRRASETPFDGTWDVGRLWEAAGETV